jgi:hypothetical protein
VTIKEGKAIPLTGRGGPYGCKTSRFPHFLDNPLTDGGKVVSLMRRSPFTRRKISDKKLNSASELYRPTERPPLVGEVSANFSG